MDDAEESLYLSIFFCNEGLIYQTVKDPNFYPAYIFHCFSLTLLTSNYTGLIFPTLSLFQFLCS